MKTKIFLLLILLLPAVLIGQSVSADTSSVSVLPSSGQKTAVSYFDVTVSLNPAGNKVCVVKGTLTFENLTCNAITTSQGLVAQVSPTCNSPNFVIGIPDCATAQQNLFSISVKAGNAGQAGISITQEEVISDGIALATIIQNGKYNIEPAPVLTQTEENINEEDIVVTPEEAQEILNSQLGQAKMNTDNLIPKTAGLAEIGKDVSRLIESPIFIVVTVIVILLLILWIADMFISHRKNSK